MMVSARSMDGSVPGGTWNCANSPVPMPTMTASTSTLMPDDTTLPNTRSARNAVLFHSANGTSTKPASVVSLNSISVTKSCTANTKKLTITTSQARNSTVMTSRCANTSGKPVMSLICAMMGRAASTPTLASSPGRRNCACVSVEPDATSPSPAKERNRMPARLLKLPMMKAKAPTYSVFLISLPITSSPPMAQNSPASVMSITTSVAVRNATSPCSNPKPESM